MFPRAPFSVIFLVFWFSVLPFGLLRGRAESGDTDNLEQNWTPLFDGDSLDGWKSANFGGEGAVTVREGQIVMEPGIMLTGITWQRDFPATDYEIQLKANRLEGRDFFCGLTFPVAESHCTLIVAGWAGAVVGLSCVDGRDASENETTQFMSFENDRWYVVRLRVTSNRITAWIDDQQVVDLETTGRHLAPRPEVDLSKPLGIAAWQSRTALKDVRYRQLQP